MTRVSSTARYRPPRPRAWLRLLVLLLALLVPGVHFQAQALPAPTVAAETSEHDVHHGTLLRPPARSVHRAQAPERTAPLLGPAPARPAAPSCPAAPLPPHAVPLLRTVVLRC